MDNKNKELKVRNILHRDFRPYIDRGYSININMSLRRHHIFINRHYETIFDAIISEYPSNDFIVSVIKKYERNKLINELLNLP
jgi:hypothetical protein